MLLELTLVIDSRQPRLYFWLMDSRDHILRALEISGSQRSLGLIAGVSQPAVCSWLKGVKRPSAISALRIEAATNGEVSRSDLRPDLWPPENNNQLASASPQPPEDSPHD